MEHCSNKHPFFPPLRMKFYNVPPSPKTIQSAVSVGHLIDNAANFDKVVCHPDEDIIADSL